METCRMCHIFVQDWFTQPFSPDHALYDEIHPKRLLRVLPKVAPIFIRFIKDLTYYDIDGIFTSIERILINATTYMIFEPKEVVDSNLARLSWISMADHYIGKAPDDIRMIEGILKDSCVCKKGEKELIGYYLTSMIMTLKEVHSCHVSIRSASSPSPSPGDTVISIPVEKDDLYD